MQYFRSWPFDPDKRQIFCKRPHPTYINVEDILVSWNQRWVPICLSSLSANLKVVTFEYSIRYPQPILSKKKSSWLLYQQLCSHCIEHDWEKCVILNTNARKRDWTMMSTNRCYLLTKVTCSSQYSWYTFLENSLFAHYLCLWCIIICMPST